MFEISRYKINGIEFIKTCEWCPEQYYVKDMSGKIVGYVRLRFGHITCRYPDVNGKLIYEETVGDEFTGMFYDEKQRIYNLKKISDEIIKIVGDNT